MANADLLWEVINREWPKEKEWLTIEEVERIAPLCTCNITNRSSYEYAMLSLLSTNGRQYVNHENRGTENAINEQWKIVNRNNGIWRKYINSRVAKR